MRRFSQRNSLVTLSEINITPLLDLAFVLLIIFVITAQALEQGLDIKLPYGGQQDQKASLNNLKNYRTIEIDPEKGYMLNQTFMTLAHIEAELVKAYRDNPKIIVLVRADRNAPWEMVFNLIDTLQKRGILTYSFRAKPPDRRR